MGTNGKRAFQNHPALLRKSPDAVASDASEASCAAERVAKAARTLLVLDDDAAARKLEVEILHQEGYKVLQARSAEEGLALAREAGAIHLLVTNLSTPEVDGLELSHRFRTVHPKTPVLMISGSLPVLRDETRDLEHVVLLAKPFAMNELLDIVRKLLGAAPPVRVRKPFRHD